MGGLLLVRRREILLLMDHGLVDLFSADHREHADVPTVGTPEYVALRQRDQARRHQATVLLARLTHPDGDDLYHAAWLFNHGDTPEDVRRAHELASRAAALGNSKALWLSAASYDRWCMYRGLPQRYGTQIVPDGTRFRVWDTDPTVTDEERGLYHVPPLKEQEHRAAQQTQVEPQPPMDNAPPWLQAAIARWKASGAGA